MLHHDPTSLQEPGENTREIHMGILLQLRYGNTRSINGIMDYKWFNTGEILSFFSRDDRRQTIENTTIDFILCIDLLSKAFSKCLNTCLRFNT